MILARQAERVGESRFRVLESDTVLGGVRPRLLRIPTRVHDDNMYVYMYAVNVRQVAGALRARSTSGQGVTVQHPDGKTLKIPLWMLDPGASDHRLVAEQPGFDT